MNTTFRQNLLDGKYYIPETVVLAFPKDKKELDYRIAEVEGSLTGKISEFTAFSKREDNSCNYNFDNQKVTVLNVVGKRNYEFIKKKTTPSNNYLNKLIFYSENKEMIELDNEGFRITALHHPGDSALDVCYGVSTYEKSQILLAEITHPDLVNKVKEKCGYDLSDPKYRNITITVLVSYNNLMDYYSNNEKLVYGSIDEPIRFLEKSITDFYSPSDLIYFESPFIGEHEYQSKKDTTLRIPTSIGIPDKIISANQEFIPGHAYRILVHNNSFYGYCNNTLFYLLYLGKLDKVRNIVSRSLKSILQSNVLIDEFDIAELNDWDDEPRIGRVSKWVWGELEIPMDAFLIISPRSEYTESKIIKEAINSEKGFITEQQLLKICADCMEFVHDNVTERYYYNSAEVIGGLKRLILLPSSGLSMPKKGSPLEEYAAGIDKKSIPGHENAYSAESCYLSSFRHYCEISDMGKYAEIESPATTFIKNMILDAEGKYPDMFKKSELKRFGLNAFDLFSEDELKRIGKVRYENIRRNVAYAVVDLMMKFLTGYCSKMAHGKSWSNAFSDNTYDPEYESLKPGSFLSEISNQVLNDYKSLIPIGDSKVVQLDDPNAKKCILDSLVKGLVKYKNQPKGDSTRYRTSIYGILNKFDINEEILKEICKAY